MLKANSERKHLAVYVHWPFCKSKCPYCDFNSHVREGVDQKRWKNALLRELDSMHAHMPDRHVSSIFFGGGTPSLMPPATTQAIIDRVAQYWPMEEQAEITLEANPTSVEAHSFADFAQAGINRVSLGVQALNDKDLAFLGRAHSATEALKAVERARAIFRRYSFDLIYARPHQTHKEWEEELTRAFTHAGEHLSLYQLTIEENTAFHHSHKKGEFSMPPDEEAEALYRLTEAIAAVHGFSAYEVSNYAKPGEESRHNLAYWTGTDYIGIGPGAHGRMNVNGRIATQTLKSPERWLEKVEREGQGIEVWEPIGLQQEIEERVMMGLRLAEGIPFARFKAQTDSELMRHINPVKHRLYTQQGLLTDAKDRLQATLKGRLVLNRLTADLLMDAAPD